MGKHSQNKQRNRKRKIFAGVALGVGTVVAGITLLLPAGHTASPDPAPEAAPVPQVDPEYISSLSSDAELSDSITVFGQVAVKNSFNQDPLQNDFNISLIRQSQERNDPAKEKAFFDFMKQFDDLKAQFRAGGKSPQSIDAIVATVNQRVSDQIKEHASDNKDFTSPIETINNHYGNSQDIAELNEAAMQYIGLSDNRMLIARTNAEGDASKGADLDVLMVNDAPEGTPPHFVVAVSHVNQLRSTDPGDPGQVAFIDARNQRGAFFTIAVPKV